MAKITALYFHYDIPDTVQYPNPSPRLWPLGAVRYQLSCWMVPIAVRAKPEFQELIDEMAIAGVQKIRLVKISDEEEEQIREMARDALKYEAERIHTALITKLIKADNAYKAALEEAGASCEDELLVWEGTAAARKKRLKDIRNHIRRAGKELAAAVTAAEAFDETMNVADAMQGLKAAIAARSQAFQAELQAAHAMV